MKKTFLVIAAVTLGALTATNTAHSQNLVNSLILKSPKLPPIAADSSSSKTNDLSPTTDLRLITPKALKDFTKGYKSATSVQWFKIKDGFVAYCRINGIKSKVYYDSRSHWTGTLQSYDEKNLPREIRNIVKSTYYDFKINVVEEIQIDNRIIYRVHLEDETSFKTVNIFEGEMTVVEDFRKAL